MSAPASASASADRRTNNDGAEQRRPASRHFHCGPRPVKGSDSGSGSGGGVAAETLSKSDPPTTAVILHRHALEGVFAFLELSELAAALRVARDWLAAVGSMRRLELALTVESDEPIRVVCQSAVGRHVAVLGRSSERVQLNADTLFILADRMAHLRELHCHLELPPPKKKMPVPYNWEMREIYHAAQAVSLPPWAGPPRFPANLRQLDVRLRETDAAHVIATIAAIGRLPQLETLLIALAAMGPQISFAPLIALPLLRHLDVWWQWDESELSDAQVDELRALPHLHEVEMVLSVPLLRRLLRQPHNLQWRQISLPWSLDDEYAALLPLLPSLTTIYSNQLCCERFDWLRGLPSLTDVSLTLNGSVDAAGRAASLVAALHCCTNIEILELNRCVQLTAAQLAELLLRLPQLRELRLIHLEIDSLAFLAQPPLTSQLSRLELRGCSELPLSELRHVHGLRGLKQLELSASFTAPLDEYSQSLFQPPSILLPQLKFFSYTPPYVTAAAAAADEDDDDDDGDVAAAAVASDSDESDGEGPQSEAEDDSDGEAEPPPPPPLVEAAGAGSAREESEREAAQRDRARRDNEWWVPFFWTAVVPILFLLSAMVYGYLRQNAQPPK